jgi:CRISPR-associated endonuclease/helicase Cas3
VSNPEAGFWAKLDPGTDNHHPVFCHLVDVGAVCHALWRDALPAAARSRMAGAFGLHPDDAGRWVAFWVAAHDLGKLSPGFQGKADRFRAALAAAGLPFHPDPSPPPHGTVTAAVLPDLLAAPDGWAPLDRPTAARVAVAVGGHHGVFPRAEETVGLGRVVLGGPKWAAARREHLGALARAFGVAGLPPPRPPAADDHAPFILLAGLCVVADWVGSARDFFPFAGDAFDPATYPALAAWRAVEAVAEVGWAGAPAAPAAFRDLFGFAPRPLQARAEEVAGTLSGPGLVVAEAPMGEGKTEAALLLADAWAATAGRPGLYVALPTAATGNAMFRRVRDFLARRLPGGRVNLHLLHGQALLSDGYWALRPAAVYDPDGPDGRVVAEGWFVPRKRALLAPFGVGTIDQALLAVLQTRHGFVRLFGLAGKTVVVDEVHAYDAYMSTLLERLLAWLAALGCPVVLLSATLPRAKRAALVRAYAGRDVPVDEAPYPRLLAVGGGAARSLGFPASRPTTVALDRLRRTDLAARLGAALAGGGCAAVLCNTVARAQEVFGGLAAALRPAGVEVGLFHARFPFGRRAEIEREAVRAFGKDGPRPRRAVLVATQVVEQSLDLDFDLMATEWAPADLLLQRAGRLHRHDRDHRPAGLDRPRLWLLDPDAAPSGVPAFGPSEYVYSRAVLLRSYLALQGVTEVRLPDDIERLVEAVYGDGGLPAPDAAWAAALAAARAELDGELAADRAVARRVLVNPPDHPDDILQDFCQQLEEEAPDLHPTLQALTRLGEPTVQLVCLERCPGGVRPYHGGGPPVDLAAEPTVDAARRLLRAGLSLNHRALVPHFLAEAVPAGWRRSGLLRHHRAAVFEDGALHAAGYAVRLDDEEGCVVTKGGEGGS